MVDLDPAVRSKIQGYHTSQVSSRVNFFREVHCLLGLPFDSINLEGAVDTVCKAASNQEQLVVSTPNMNFLVGCLGDEDFRLSVLNSDLCLADGMSIVWIARLLGLPIVERAAGSDLFDALKNRQVRAPDAQLGVYFFGGVEGVAQAACAELNCGSKSSFEDRISGLRCCGYMSPGFGSIDEMSTPQTIQKINDSRANFLILSLGARKGQAWIERNRKNLTVPVISHLGAVVNFVSGRIARAPKIAQRIGLEWLWRIKEEPELWRRYFGDGFVLMKLLLTRVLPLALLSRFMHHVYGYREGGSFEIDIRSNSTLLRLWGDWNGQDLVALRKALQQASSESKSVVFDIKRVTGVDSAFLGLMLLVRGYQCQNGGGPIARPSSRLASSICRLSCSSFIFD